MYATNRETLMDRARKLVNSRTALPVPDLPSSKLEAEGGCGVIGVASTTPIEGKYLLQSMLQMKNRGNGKGGGIAAVGLVPEQVGVSREVLEQDYLVQVAYLDQSSRTAVEREFITPAFQVDHSYKIPAVEDYRSVGLEVRPPDVYTYFCRVRPEALERFLNSTHLHEVDRSSVEDEFVYQNTYRLNLRFYSSLGEKKAFVVSHGKNMMVLKLVGYGDQVIRYYQLEDFKANIWIGHHRYPTKGRVWHPGGAHPFVGLHEALVHNGDFANYHSMTEYLAQRNIHPLFLTDTEVSVLLFDLLSRVYRYPLEYLIEAMAPTTERDFEMLPEEKRKIYRTIQTAHIHGSPDGPWFFIVARNDPSNGVQQLLGITDTSMLRPQVFALQEGKAKIGIIASERQAINAMLRKLTADGKLPSAYADMYWNARGGSHTDGGAFGFTLRDSELGKQLVCTEKFGRELSTPSGQFQLDRGRAAVPVNTSVALQIQKLRNSYDPMALFEYLCPIMKEGEYGFVADIMEELRQLSKNGDRERSFTLDTLTLLFDRIYDTGTKKRSSVLQLLDEALEDIFSTIPVLNGISLHSRLDWENRTRLRPPSSGDQSLVLDILDFPAEGNDSAARFLVEAYRQSWKRLILYNIRGHRFIANGLGPRTNDLRIDCYGDVGDYAASGIDGAEVNIHGAAQDQAAQIMKYGKLVIHGDVGQAFMYAAKGGQVYVMGNAAGRPLINAVGKPKVVINGTCLDYLAESFMAGDPSNGGGFVIVNGLKPTHDGRWVEQQTPYPGSNLFSLASGGAIFIRDPHRMVTSDQLNGGRLADFTEKDWNLILPQLQENERLFGISVKKDLLNVNGGRQSPSEVYRKIEPVQLQELS